MMKMSTKQVAYLSAVVMSLVAVGVLAKYVQAWTVCTYKFEIDCVNDDNWITACQQWIDDVHGDAEMCLRPTTAWDDNLNYDEDYDITLRFYVEGDAGELLSLKIGTFKNRAGNSNDEIVWQTTGYGGPFNYIGSANGTLSGSQSSVHFEADVFGCIGSVVHIPPGVTNCNDPDSCCKKDIEMTVELHYHHPGSGMPPTPIDDHDTVESDLCEDEVMHGMDCSDTDCHDCEEGPCVDCDNPPCGCA